MSLFSFSFFVFLCVGVLVYYLLPGRWQWVCLLVLSGGFYACAGPAGLLFPAVTIVTTWLGGLAMARVDRLCTVEDGFIRQAMVLLMTKAKEIARAGRYRALILETQSCNCAAVSFYLSQGLTLMGFNACEYSNEDIAKHEVRLEMGCLL